MKASVFLLFQTFLLVIGVVGVMVAAVPWIAIPVIPLGIVFFFVGPVGKGQYDILAIGAVCLLAAIVQIILITIDLVSKRKNK